MSQGNTTGKGSEKTTPSADPEPQTHGTALPGGPAPWKPVPSSGPAPRMIIPRALPRSDYLLTLGCAVALTLILSIGMLASRTLREVSSLMGGPELLRYLLIAACLGVLAVSSMSSLRMFQRGRGLAASTGCTLIMCLCQVAAMQLASPIAAFLTITSFGLTCTWLIFLFACCLTRLPDKKLAAVACTCGIVTCQFALPLYSLPVTVAAKATSLTAVCLTATAISYILARPVLDALTANEPISLIELTNPDAPLQPSRHIYTCILLVSLAYRFSTTTLKVPGAGLLRFSVVAAMLAILLFLLVAKDEQEDKLFSLIVAFIIAGFMFALAGSGTDTSLAHTFHYLGSSCFTVLIWLLVWSLGRRNISAMVPFVGLAFGASYLGEFLGANIIWTMDALGFDSGAAMTSTVTLFIALAFFCFVWFTFKDFSFCSAIRGVQSTEEIQVTPLPTAQDTQDQSADATYEERLRTMAVDAQLTPRETEIFGLLARGRNAGYIMETLSVTRNTAKAHISHVYNKLGVHSQQELLSLVEDHS